jgi:uncharacterized protein
MDLLSITLIIAGLVLFETITSIDNAIINAEVLSSMSERAKRWFLIWGLLFAVFAIRGLLPWLIVWLSNSLAESTRDIHRYILKRSDRYCGN